MRGHFGIGFGPRILKPPRTLTSPVAYLASNVQKRALPRGLFGIECVDGPVVPVSFWRVSRTGHVVACLASNGNWPIPRRA